MRKIDFVSEIKRKGFCKDCLSIAMDTTNNREVSSLLLDFIDFDKLKTDSSEGITSVDTVVIGDDLCLIEFKHSPIVNRNLLFELRLNFYDSLIVLVNSYNKHMSQNIDLPTLLNSFGRINYNIVFKQMSQGDRERLKIVASRFKNANSQLQGVSFFIQNVRTFERKFRTFSYDSQTF